MKETLGNRRWQGGRLDLKKMPIAAAAEWVTARRQWLEEELEGCEALHEKLSALLEPSRDARPVREKVRRPVLDWALDVLGKTGGAGHVADIARLIEIEHDGVKIEPQQLASVLFKAAKRGRVTALGGNRYSNQRALPGANGHLSEADGDAAVKVAEGGR